MNQPQKPFTLFFIIWTGQLLSRIGSGISAFALGIYLYQQTGSTSTYSFLLLCAFLPSVVLAPIGGVIADRKDRKLMMVLGDFGSSFGILFIIVMFLFYPDKQWPIYLGLAISSMGVALHSPAFKATVTDLLDVKEYSKASGLLQFAEASRYVVSPIIAGFLLTHLSLSLVLVIDMITFVVAAITVTLIRNMTIQSYHEGKKEGFRKDFTDGIRYIASNEIICHLLYLTTVVTFLTGILQVLFVPIALSFTDVVTLGIVQSVAASGMLASSLFIGLLSKSDQRYKVLSCSLGVTGLFYLLIGTSTNIVLFTATVFCFFLTLPFVNSSLDVLFRQNIAKEMQGRIWSLISLISQVGMLVALSITGVLADHLFDPLLTDNSPLAETVGSVLGTGSARGSQFMVIISGFFLVLYSLFSAKRRSNLKGKNNFSSTQGGLLLDNLKSFD